MNLNISQISFKAKCVQVNCPSSTAKADMAFNEAILKLDNAKKVCIKSQEYVSDFDTRVKFAQLPKDDIIVFQNINPERENILNTGNSASFARFSFTNPSMLYWKANGTEKRFEFKLDERGNLNEKEADAWLDSLILDCKA